MPIAGSAEEQVWNETTESGQDVFSGGGEMGALMRSINWAKTSLGPVEFWPASLKTVLRLLLSSESQICVLWGPELIQFYNDGFVPSSAQ